MPTSYRLPDDIQANIKRLAKEHDRSENGEVIHALRVYIRSMQMCSECKQPAEIECKIGKCSPSTCFCGKCYIEKHLPDDQEEVFEQRSHLRECNRQQELDGEMHQIARENGENSTEREF